MLAGVPSGTVEATLTGRAATDALRTYLDLANLNARFDGRRVAEAIRSARGRARLLVAVIVAPMRAPRSARGIATSPRRSRVRRTTRSSSSGSEPHPGLPEAVA